jgi:hypothetical protein
VHIHVNKSWLLPTGIGAGGLTLGFGAGFGLSQFRSKKKLQEIQDGYFDLQGKIRHLGQQLKERAAATEQLSAKLDMLAEAERAGHPSVAEVEEAKVISIFPEVTYQDWNQEKETEYRDKYPERPHVIRVEEFQANEFGFSQHTYTYYAGDQVLVDEQDVPVYNHSNVVGDLLFGYGSGDPNVVYIRNVRGKAEYEILQDHGHYAVEVLGNEIESEHAEADLKHSGDRRFRRDD